VHTKTARILPSNAIDEVMANRNMKLATVTASVARDIGSKNKVKTGLIKIPVTVHTGSYLNADSSKTTGQAPQAKNAYLKTFLGAGRCNIAAAAGRS
jgi:inner membrane protein involved in colicin E2 resistance